MFSDPEKNLEQFDLQKGMRVADFGAGSGFYAFAAARLVGDKGKVFAVDIQKDLLTRLKKEAAAKKLLNIEIVWGDLEKAGGAKLKDNSVDRLIISNLLFQIGGKENLAKEATRVLKPNGKVLAIDWTDSFGGLGPPDKDIFGKAAARALFENAGFVLERTIDTGVHHYGLVFVKK
ncbi:MAG: methylase involved in ubiquinone/menaquinone biosynthesi [Parcubacteria group bacterium Gr01-1014_73]|nr:MAG: methylase involved in ubiquinone/menaquinone biosynthesi [Parcubacteria group bacterium Gr01-1014_73]